MLAGKQVRDAQRIELVDSASAVAYRVGFSCKPNLHKQGLVRFVLLLRRQPAERHLPVATAQKLRGCGQSASYWQNGAPSDHFCPCSLSQHGRCVGVQSCQCVVDDFYYEYTACLNGTRTKRFRKLESRSSSVRAIA